MNKSELKKLYSNLKQRNYLDSTLYWDGPTSYNDGVIITDASGNSVGALDPTGNVIPFEGNPYEMYEGDYTFMGDTATPLNTLYNRKTGHHYTIYNLESDY